jgi:hypothetical protein
MLRSAFGKARGQALRLALVIEMLWWCGEEGMSQLEEPPPSMTSKVAAPSIVFSLSLCSSRIRQLRTPRQAPNRAL